jgi:phosphatidylserine/phosphatidylglycerophosphate/cardiolipin synthase-like enzyme
MRNDLADELPGKSVKSIIEGKSNKVRDFMGGYLSAEIFDILDNVIKHKNLTIFAALYELKQTDLIEKLKKLGKRANVILANGAFKKSRQDMNKNSRKELRKAKVKVFDRIVGSKHFAHNKFLVICNNKKPLDVWSGSTNWTPGGLFSQVNNGIYIKNNPALAKHYINEWEALKEAESEYTQDLFDANEEAKEAGDIKVWFSPTENMGDLNEAGKLMEKAENGILFLMFNPGPRNTLFNKVIELQKDEDLYIHGIINQDPGASVKNPLIFFHRGEQVKTDWNSILPKKINKAFSFWYPESGSGFVTIHSKVIVIDPFGKNPVVITGSNNLGPKASGKNDENLLIIHNRRLAEEYAVNIMSVYEHYRWRYSLFHKNTKFKGLTRDKRWMKNYMNSSRFSELKFWMGK